MMRRSGVVLKSWRGAKAAICRAPVMVAAAAAAIACGCASPERFRATAQPGGKYLVHVVSPRSEGIQEICEWYTGGIEGQPAIVSANPGIDLSTLKPGDRVLIPYVVVKRIEPLGSGAAGEPPQDSSPEAAAPVREEVPVGDLMPPRKGTTAHQGPEPELDPLEELSRKQGEAGQGNFVAPGAPISEPSPNAADSGALETFDLQDDVPPASQPSGGSQQQPIKAPAANTPYPQEAPAGRRVPSAQTQRPTGQPQDPSVEDLRRELGLGN